MRKTYPHLPSSYNTYNFENMLHYASIFGYKQNTYIFWPNLNTILIALDHNGVPHARYLTDEEEEEIRALMVGEIEEPWTGSAEAIYDTKYGKRDPEDYRVEYQIDVRTIAEYRGEYLSMSVVRKVGTSHDFDEETLQHTVNTFNVPIQKSDSF